MIDSKLWTGEPPTATLLERIDAATREPCDNCHGLPASPDEECPECEGTGLGEIHPYRWLAEVLIIGIAGATIINLILEIFR